MPDLDRALLDISHIRTQLARGSEFHGYGPATVGMTSILALLAATAQSFWITDPHVQQQRYLYLWACTAAGCFGLIMSEAVIRARRAHGEMAFPMLQSALEQFLPSIVAGGLLSIVLPIAAPGSVWMLPGLWQIIFSLGVFASSRLLPRAIYMVGVWYLCTGLSCLALLGPGRSFSPWAMGVPFTLGQLLVAVSLNVNHDEI